MPKFIQNILTKHRGWIIFFTALPLSFVYQRIQDLRNWIYRNFFATNKLHDRMVQEIQGAVQEAHQSGQLMCTARPVWKTMSIRKATYKNDCAQIPINLKNILNLDHERMTIRVEPMVTMGDITHFLIPKGYALSVQVEMDDLTVGGLCMGLGIETTSHHRGFLFETISAYEIVTADGELLKVTKDSHPDLFHTLPMSRGTLGFLVAVELAIVPVKRYMKLTYHPCQTRATFSETLRKYAEDENGPKYLEGLYYENERGVVMTGELVDKPGKDGKRNPINRWYKPWFYTHVEEFLDKGEAIEYIPLRQYFHRHTPSIFFQLKDIIPFANTRWYRWFFAWLGAPKISLMKYTMTKELRKRSIQNRVAQDMIIPINGMEDALKFTDDHFAIYPNWICPVRFYDHGEDEGFLRNPRHLQAGKNYEMHVDIGVYGIPPAVRKGTWNGIETHREMEEYAREHHGMQMLYADIFMTKKEFEAMFEHQLYRLVRTKYHADKAFPEVYEKVIPEKWLVNIDELAAKDAASTENSAKEVVDVV